MSLGTSGGHTGIIAFRPMTDWLVLLGTGRDLYLEVGERKSGRSRWIAGVGLQTTDAAEEWNSG